MKRSIICLSCGSFIKKDPPKTVLELEEEIFRLKSCMYHEEKYKRLLGSARGTLCCDFCAKEIKKGEDCYTESIFDRNNGYYEWESAYIDSSIKSKSMLDFS